jgi:hypothetical protein
MTHKITWIDSGREPQCDADPRYPDGKDIPLLSRSQESCRVELPYPAKRCGVYIVDCETCGLRYAITTAGRPDDPRSVMMACVPKPN